MHVIQPVRNVITNMDKKELLREIAQKELNRLQSLSYEKLSKEASDWFQDEELASESREDILNDLFEDFMRYREQENEKELEIVLKRYK